jgi:hypothetical protein
MVDAKALTITGLDPVTHVKTKLDGRAKPAHGGEGQCPRDG